MTETVTSQDNKKGTAIDYLTEDAPMPNQKYVCISFVSPEGIKNCNIRSVKVRGVFEDYEQARKHAEDLQKKDPNYHIFVGEVGKWLPWDPSPDSAKDQQYYEKQLQDLHKGYLQNREKAKQTEAERKQDMLRKSVAEAAKDDRTLSTKARLQKQLQENKMKKESNMHIPQSLEERDKLMQQEKERVAKNQTKIVETENKVKSIEENINKIKELWAKQKEKKEQAK